MNLRCTLALLLASLTWSAAETPSEPLNVVFILTDNHGAWTLGCYGNPDIQTPHIDQLASEGARFTRAFANNGVCSPTRATFLTGLMPSQHGVHNFLVGGRLQTGPEPRNTLENFRSLPEILKDQGYRCGLVGKWHLGDNLRPQEGLEDYWITMPHGGTSTFFGAKIIENGEIRTEDEHLTTFWTRHAVQFLEESAQKEDPFFLYLAYNGPYGLSRFQIEPLRGPRAADYADKTLTSFPGGVIHPWEFNNREYFGNATAIRRYAAELSAVDDGVGEVMATLKRLGKAENTLVIFAADQGWAGGQRGFWGMGDHTRPLNAYEHSMQIPMIFHHPAGIPGGQEPDLLVSNYDFLPSVLGYLDLEGELSEAPQSPGRDFSPLLRGEQVSGWENAVFFEHENLRSVRTESWKLVERYADGYDELFDLKADPEELNNLHGQVETAEIQTFMEGRLNAFFEDYAEPEYDLWKGGGAQTRLFVWGEEAQARERERAERGLAPTAFDLGFNPPKFELPEGYVAEVVAAPPLVEHPMMAAYDDQGRLFVAEASGVNLNQTELEKELPNYVRMLEDTNNDGFYDKTTRFAEDMTFPQGVLWLDGSLYVASPPGIWKLTDRDGDGVADERVEIATGFDYTGNAADVHGPFLHPNGRIYWCHGRKGHAVFQQDGTLVSENKGARIWSCRPDGRDIRVHAGGGMDNPVEIDFLPSGEIVGSVNLFYGRPRGDVLVHWILGGRYPRYDQGTVLEEFKSTGEPLTEIYNFGHVAVSGMCRASSGEIYTTLFNTQEVHRSTLQAQGSTFSAKTEPFLKIQDPDVHLTDILEDADGSLLLVDTGGWFRIGCPTSQIAKPDIPGAIYRIRKAGPMDRKADWYGRGIDWASLSPEALAGLLDDEKGAVRNRAIRELASRGDAALVALRVVLREGDVSARTQAIWTLIRIESDQALAMVREALGDQDAQVRQAACNSIVATQDGRASRALLALTKDQDPAVRRAAATALGSIRTTLGIPALVKLLQEPEDRFLEHAAMYALIQGDQFDAVRRFAPSSGAARGRVFWALDQMDSGELQAADVLPLLADEDSRGFARKIAARHPEWAPELAKHFAPLAMGKPDPRWLDDFRAVGPSMLSELTTRDLVGQLLQRGAVKTQQAALEVLAESAVVRPMPESWRPVFENLLRLDHAQLDLALRALAKLEAPDLQDQLQQLAGDKTLPARTRLLALRTSHQGDTVSGPGFELLMTMLRPSASPEDRAEAVAILSQLRLTKPQLLQLAAALSEASPVDFAPMLAAFARSRDAEVGAALSASLVKAPAVVSLPASEVRRYLSRYPLDAVTSALARLDELESQQQQKLVKLESLVNRVKAEGDIERGRMVFNTGMGTCNLCHQVGDQGKDVGPNLTTIGRIRSERDLLESILFPGASIARDFEAYLVTMEDGAIHTGVIREETEQVLRLTNAGGLQVDLDRSAVKSRKAAPASLMPMGLELTLTEQQLLDLVAYLDSLE